MRLKQFDRLSEEERQAVVRLCQQGERFLLDGKASQGLTLLAQAWERAYAQAPDMTATSWPQACDALVRVCRELGAAELSAEPQPLPLLQISSLGHFAIVREGTQLPDCRARKALAIVRFLLTRHGRSAHKDELIELFWPETAPREALHSLHVAISALRRYLEPDEYLRFSGEHYTLDGAISYDCDEFERLSELGNQAAQTGEFAIARVQYRAALDCYRGDYRIERYDRSWALVERERLLTRYLDNLDQCGRIAIAEQDYPEAIDAYSRLIARDAYREDAHRQLMRCYLRLDRRADALSQYRRCASILAAELGLEPLPETKRLYEEIASG